MSLMRILSLVFIGIFCFTGQYSFLITGCTALILARLIDLEDLINKKSK